MYSLTLGPDTVGLDTRVVVLGHNDDTEQEEEREVGQGSGDGLGMELDVEVVESLVVVNEPTVAGDGVQVLKKQS